ncbi:MAG: TerB family tellurite resistance protein [Bacteroidales bacterium]|nr:TerB family tellurite resistance protein [Bacteroidales bacterium]
MTKGKTGLRLALKQTIKTEIMAQPAFNELLLQTAFSCMASDGDIDQSEVQLIKSLENDEQLFGFENIENELNRLVKEINQNGHDFLREYLHHLSQSDLTEKQEIQIVRTAVKTIKADNDEKYSEIKFFKIIRSKLSGSNKTLIEALPEFKNLEEDYLQQDIISESYLEKLTADYFDKHDITEFAPIELDSNE